MCPSSRLMVEVTKRRCRFIPFLACMGGNCRTHISNPWGVMPHTSCHTHPATHVHASLVPSAMIQIQVSATSPGYTRLSPAPDHVPCCVLCRNLREVAEAERLDDYAKAAFLISHRCRCAPAGQHSPCADKEQLADACARTGRTPFREEADYVAE